MEIEILGGENKEIFRCGAEKAFEKGVLMPLEMLETLFVHRVLNKFFLYPIFTENYWDLVKKFSNLVERNPSFFS